MAEVIRAHAPELIDVSSGLEAEPGRKDHDKLRALFQAVAGAGARRPAGTAGPPRPHGSAGLSGAAGAAAAAGGGGSPARAGDASDAAQTAPARSTTRSTA